MLPWLVVAWHLRLIKATAWKWLLSLVLAGLAFFIFTLSAYYVSGATPGDVIAPLVAIFILTGISVAILFPFVLRATLLDKVDSKRGKNILVSILLCFATLFFFFYATGFMGSTRARIALDHSINLPSSASHIVCEDFFTLTPFSDAGASASFEISRNDLPAVLAQFPKGLDKPLPDDHGPMTAPSNFKGLIARYRGGSRDGNVCWIDVFEVDAQTDGVVIATSWN